MGIHFLSIACLISLSTAAFAAPPSPPVIPPLLVGTNMNYGSAAGEVMRHVQTSFYLPDSGLYAQSLTQREPDFMWGNGVVFTALAGATRHDKQYLPLMNRFFKSLDRYWDAKAAVPGYEPSPTAGRGNDKYYDDNAWMVLAFLEAYDLTADKAYVQRADQTLTFVLSGWDEKRGGGIWWHETHKGNGKNTCVNAPAAVGCLRLADYTPKSRTTKSIEMAKRLVDWTTQTLQADDGRYYDNINVDTGQVERTKWTYNTALMMRADLGLYRRTGDATYLDKAKRTAKAAEAFADKDSGVFTEKSYKFTHLLVEADLEMFRATGEEYLLRRAIVNADHAYNDWKRQPPPELIENASIARMLWLMADMQTERGLKFWQRVEQKSSATKQPG